MNHPKVFSGVIKENHTYLTLLAHLSIWNKIWDPLNTKQGC